jgi:hypothetical protein
MHMYVVNLHVASFSFHITEKEDYNTESCLELSEICLTGTKHLIDFLFSAHGM